VPVILASNPPLLSSTLWAIARYAHDPFSLSPPLLSGHAGFCFATLQSALTYVQASGVAARAQRRCYASATDNYASSCSCASATEVLRSRNR
jgi:hypothetical protein